MASMGSGAVPERTTHSRRGEWNGLMSVKGKKVGRDKRKINMARGCVPGAKGASHCKIADDGGV